MYILKSARDLISIVRPDTQDHLRRTVEQSDKPPCLENLTIDMNCKCAEQANVTSTQQLVEHERLALATQAPFSTRLQ
jgi:hypothetical protein